MIEGVSTCDKGYISIRLYEGTGEAQKFVGVGVGFIEGHTFTTFVQDAAKTESLCPSNIASNLIEA